MVDEAENPGRKKRDNLRPTFSPENQIQRCIGLAYDEAERRLADGTATSQLICAFIEMGTAESKLRLAELEAEIKLKETKAESIATMADYERVTREAIEAMSHYTGNG